VDVPVGPPSSAPSPPRTGSTSSTASTNRAFRSKVRADRRGLHLQRLRVLAHLHRHGTVRTRCFAATAPFV